MNCTYECHQIGGPWIAENPDCPFHGREAIRYQDEHDARFGEIEKRLERIEKLLLSMKHP